MSCSRLSELCGQLLSHQAPRLDPHEFADIILKKYVDVECILLQLSTLRQLYSSSSFSPSPTPAVGEECEEDKSDATGVPPTPEDSEALCYSKYTAEMRSCISQCLPDLLHELVGHLQSENQFISFCASKALVCVMLQSGVQDQSITDIFSTLKTGVHSHVGVYSLQTIREVFKSLRKRLHTLDSTLDATVLTSLHSSFKSLTEHQLWPSALNLLCNKVSSHALQQVHGKLELTVGEFLSLTVEMIRHEQPSQDISSNSSSSFESSLPLHTNTVIEDLPKLLSLIELHSNLFLLKRFVDIALKLAEKAGPAQVVQYVAPVLAAVLGLPLCRELLHYWMKECSIELLPVSVSRALAHSYSIADNFEYKMLKGKSSDECGLVGTTVRKLTVFCLKCIACVISILPQPLPSTAITVDNLLSALKKLLSFVFSNRAESCDLRLFTEVLFHVVSEEDSCLIQTLQSSHHTWWHTKTSEGAASSSAVQMFLTVVNPHTLWLLFLQSISYDHSVLLDLLLSPEAKFRGALHSYLELVAADWDAFEEVCRERSTPDCSSVDSGALYSLTSGDSSEHIRDTLISGRKGQDRSEPSLSPPAPKKTKHEEQRSANALVEYSSSSDEEDVVGTGGTVLPDDGPQAGNSIAPPLHLMPLLPSPSSPIESLVDRVLSCFIYLRLVLERLERTKLLPADFSAGDVIRGIARVEEIYEGET